MQDFDRSRQFHSGCGQPDDDFVTVKNSRERQKDGRFQVGDLIMNRYKILAELGQGGMGVVYKCFDEIGGIEVALKALPPELSHNTLEMEDIKDNFQLVSRLIHQNIAISKNLERDNSNGNYYLIMECVGGEDLRRWLRRKRKEGPLTLDDVLPIIRQVADALDYAHGEKIIHRDIKPGNIMIDQFGKIKVLDFGLAAQLHTSMTRVSMAYHGTSGTGPYMAPEQWRGRAQGAAADQYALAVMTYEMLAGHLPFESTDAAVLREVVLNDTPVEIPNVPKNIQVAIRRAMSKDPAVRFASCSDFVAALGGKKFRPAKISSGTAFPKWAAAVIVLALLAAGAAGYFLFEQHKAKVYQEELARTTQLKITETLSLAKDASSRSQWREVLRLTKTVLQLDANNTQALELQNEANRKLALALTQETYRLQNKVKNKAARLASANHARSESFGKYLDAFNENAATGETALKNSDLRAAHLCFKSALEAVAWIEKNAPLRRKVQILRQQILAQKAEADKFDGSKLSYASYQAAVAKAAQADKDCDSGDFTSALALFQAALSEFRKACVDSRELFLENLISQADLAIKNQQWDKVQKIAEEIRPHNRARANKLLSEVEEQFKQGKISKLLTDARCAKIMANWPKVCRLAKEVLALNAGNQDAAQLLKEAEQFSEPTLQISAEADGNTVSAQFCWGKDKVFNTGEMIGSLPDGDFAIFVFTEINDSIFYAEHPVTRNWKGLKKITVQLNKLQSDSSAFKKLFLKALQYDKNAQNSIGYKFDFGQGVEKDPVQAVYWYKKAAGQNHAMAQCNLGISYENGQGIEKDPVQAVYWYRKAAEQGLAEAQNCLAVCYGNGTGIKKDYTQAFYWHKKAAEQGLAKAQNNLGFCYENGQGVEKNQSQAVYWYKKAANQNDTMAQCNLGICYENGQGVEKDPVQAVYWYRKAAELGFAKAQNCLAVCYGNGIGIKKDYTQAVYWYRKAAEQGFAKAQNDLGFSYENGRGVEKNQSQALYWYRKAANQNYAMAQCNVGICYENGQGVEKDVSQAIYWYRKAAEQNYANAQYCLSINYRKGIGVAQDHAQAVYWCRKAAEQGHAKAQNSLGVAYYSGQGVEKSFSQAASWFRRAAEQGNKFAQCNLGECYRDGEGVRKDLDLARYWFIKSMEQGYQKAKKNLDNLSQ